jgi:pimeloyl-ACP methyl ester carboxylesterase
MKTMPFYLHCSALFVETGVNPKSYLVAFLTTMLVVVPAAHASVLQGRSCHLPGSEEALRCIKLPVPLDYAKPDAGRIELHVTVAPAFREAAKPDPLFVLAGGPGQAGSDVLPLLNAAFRKARATRDIVLIDQRGTGLSGKLDCPSKPGADNQGEAAAEAEIRACLQSVKAPLSAYTTEAAARDIEQVRIKLGYGRINVWGGSYGTRLGQAYARAFPNSVRSLVLDGVAAPDQIIPAGGRDGQAALDAMFKLCAADSGCARAYPDLRAEFASLLDRTGKGIALSIVNPRTAEPLQMTMSSRRFLGTVHSILYATPDARRLPFLIHSAYLGRWEPFVARSNLASDIAGDSATSLILHLAVVCAEDLPRLTPQLLAEDTRDAFLGAPMVERLSNLCPLAHVRSVPFVAPSQIEAPALLLSGALDPVTPPRRAEAAAHFMRHAQQLVVAAAGHGVSTLGCAPRLLREFLDQPARPVDAACLKEIAAPTFQLGSAGTQP